VTRFTESVVEDAALAWLESLGYVVKHGLEIAPGELLAERTDYCQVVLDRRLRDALARLNPELPPEALEIPRKPVPFSTSLPVTSNDAEVICGCHAGEAPKPTS
jgi:hypothetical protein